MEALHHLQEDIVHGIERQQKSYTINSIAVGDEEKSELLPHHNETSNNNDHYNTFDATNTDTNNHIVNVNNESSDSYYSLLKCNRSFRLFILSYNISCAGGWFTYVASIEMMERILGPKSFESRAYFSLLAVSRLIPYIILSPFGGVVADSKDRRKAMIVFDVFASVVSLLYLAALQFLSIDLLLLTTFLQTCTAALYEPSRSAIIPLMVPDEEDQKKATTLAGLSWSLMAAVGSALGGFMLPIIGMRTCYLIDSLSFLLSACILWMIGGSWNVQTHNHIDPIRNDKHSSSIWKQLKEGLSYLQECSFGPLVFFKASAALAYGGFDVINVSISDEVEGSTEGQHSVRLGILSFAIGVGCVAGPLLSDYLTDAKNPRSILLSCVISSGFVTLGSFGIAYVKPLIAIAFFTGIRSSGASNVWIQSQILIQMFCKPDILGRVVAIDYVLATASEALSATLAGMIQDDLGYNAREVSLLLSLIALISLIYWIWYSVYGRGTHLA